MATPTQSACYLTPGLTKNIAIIPSFENVYKLIAFVLNCEENKTYFKENLSFGLCLPVKDLTILRNFLYYLLESCSNIYPKQSHLLLKVLFRICSVIDILCFQKQLYFSFCQATGTGNGTGNRESRIETVPVLTVKSHGPPTTTHHFSSRRRCLTTKCLQ